MKKIFLIASAALTFSFLSGNLFAQTAPAAPPVDVLATISSNADYNDLALAIRVVNVQATVTGAGPYTIFAPLNTAFSTLSQGKLDSLFADPVRLAALVKGHIVSGKYDKAAIIKAIQAKTPLTTLDGKTLTLIVNDKKHVQLNSADGGKAQIISFDIPATNGVVIGIDAVLVK
jgi:uncharacterized surface protein with fasciclin (FAS1) repeats